VPENGTPAEVGVKRGKGEKNFKNKFFSLSPLRLFPFSPNAVESEAAA
jgi:hypothetical protein